MEGYIGVQHKGGGNEHVQQVENIPCYYPLIESLEEIYTAYPNATFLYIVRDEHQWLKSIEEYHDGIIVESWKKCDGNSHFPGTNATRDDFLSFYRWHQQLIRTFAQEHPSITYIEIPLEARNAAALLEEKVGIPETCWGHYNSQKKKKRRQRRRKPEPQEETTRIE